MIRDYLICITVQIGGGSLEVANNLYKWWEQGHFKFKVYSNSSKMRKRTIEDLNE